MNPSGVFSNKSGKPLTDKQYARLKEMVAKYSGAKGSGRAYAADGVDYTPITMTNRDMEYNVLLQNIYNRINLRYGIPLAILSTEASTYNNLATANYNLYYQAILPLADRLLEELTAFLMPQYKGSENLIISYDRGEVDALRLRGFEEAKSMSDIEVFSDGEIRTVTGHDIEPTDGTPVWKRTNRVIATDEVPVETNPGNAPVDEEDQDQPPVKFMQLMLATKNSETGKNYTPGEAYQIAEAEGLLENG